LPILISYVMLCYVGTWNNSPTNQINNSQLAGSSQKNPGTNEY